MKNESTSNGIKSIKQCNGQNEYLAFFLNKEQGMRHTQYYHYSTVDNIDEILAHQTIWLSNLGIQSNDKTEKEWYCKNGKYLFSLCFSTGTSENLPLWFLYAGINGKGARISFKQNELKRLYDKNMKFKLIKVLDNKEKIEEIAELKENSDYCCYLNDIMYIGKDFTNSGMYRMKHNGNVVNKLGEDDYKIFIQEYGAFTKGLIWFYEKETRLQVKILNPEYQKIIDQFGKEDPKKAKVVVAMSLEPLKYQFSVRLGPESDEDDRKAILKKEGFKKYITNQIQFSDFKGEVKMELKESLCSKCEKNRRNNHE